jgi:isopenicillin N synthase-like dioxygenase
VKGDLHEARLSGFNPNTDQQYIDMAMTSIKIPMIDFAPFLYGDKEEQHHVATQIYNACHDIGFMYLSNHGIPQHLIDELFLQAKLFFDLPCDIKEKVARSVNTNCGYIGFEKERLNPSKPGDLKEAFNAGLKTVWLPEYDRFRDAVSEFYQLSTTVVAPNVLRAFAIALQLPTNFFDDKHGENYFLRILHYPGVTAEPSAGQLRAGEHTDYGSITLLLQDQVDGLEVRTRQGEWIAAPPIPGTVVVNVGDAMQRWTNDVLKSTPHRVVLPSAEFMSKSRYSVALFCDPNSEVELTCLESCQTRDRPSRYAPILAGDYLASRLSATY